MQNSEFRILNQLLPFRPKITYLNEPHSTQRARIALTGIAFGIAKRLVRVASRREEKKKEKQIGSLIAPKGVVEGLVSYKHLQIKNLGVVYSSTKSYKFPKLNSDF
jgi:hypothetical protein